MAQAVEVKVGETLLGIQAGSRGGIKCFNLGTAPAEIFVPDVNEGRGQVVNLMPKHMLGISQGGSVYVKAVDE